MCIQGNTIDITSAKKWNFEEIKELKISGVFFSGTFDFGSCLFLIERT